MCSVTGYSGDYELQWLRDNEMTTLSEVERGHGVSIVQVVEANLSDSGEYACQVTIGNRTYSSPATLVTVAGECGGAVRLIVKVVHTVQIS